MYNKYDINILIYSMSCRAVGKKQNLFTVHLNTKKDK